MNTRTVLLHARASFKAGRESACGSKIDYKSEESAERAASAMSLKYEKDMEAYPCVFCFGWHIGRKMSISELEGYEL